MADDDQKVEPVEVKPGLKTTTVAGLVGAIVIAVQAIITRLVAAEHINDRDRVLGVIAAILILMGFVFLLVRRESQTAKGQASELQSKQDDVERAEPSLKEKPRPLVFLAAPMASTQQYAVTKAAVMKVFRYVKEDLNIECYFAGTTIDQQDQFQTPGEALRAAIKMIKSCSSLVMIFPETAATSALVEAGLAIALKKRCIFFVGSNAQLPFLLRDSQSVKEIKIYTFINVEDTFPHLRELKPFLTGEAIRSL